MLHPNIKHPATDPAVLSLLPSGLGALDALGVAVASSARPYRTAVCTIPTPDRLDAVLQKTASAEHLVCLADEDGWGQGRENLPRLKEMFFPKVDLFIISFAMVRDFVCFKGSVTEKAYAAADELKGLGAKALLITGVGEFPHGMADYYADGEKRFWIAGKRQTEKSGKGAALATAVAGGLAVGLDMYDALTLGRTVLQSGLRQGKGFVADSFSFPGTAEDFPAVMDDPQTDLAFPSIACDELAFYPIVDSVSWVERLAPLGVPMMQLRIKDMEGEALDDEIGRAVTEARAHSCHLFINDFWELAIKHDAYGIHLGQEDLQTADLAAIAEAGVRLGISTHCYYEGAVAKGCNPSYIAFGPVYHTALKAMDFAPQGPEKLALWRRLFAGPLVGIGGVTLENAEPLLSARPVIVSVVRDVTQNPDPEARAREWLSYLEGER